MEFHNCERYKKPLQKHTYPHINNNKRNLLSSIRYFHDSSRQDSHYQSDQNRSFSSAWRGLFFYYTKWFLCCCALRFLFIWGILDISQKNKNFTKLFYSIGQLKYNFQRFFSKFFHKTKFFCNHLKKFVIQPWKACFDLEDVCFDFRSIQFV